MKHAEPPTAQIRLTGGRGAATISAPDLHLVEGYTWHLRGDGYVHAYLDPSGVVPRRSVVMHRVILGEECEGRNVDHRNLDKLDNRRSNLRYASQSQNIANSVKWSTRATSSKYKGVSWQKNAGKWAAYVMVARKRRHLGLFEDEMDAALAYDEAAREQWGEYGRFNFPGDGEVSAI